MENEIEELKNLIEQLRNKNEHLVLDLKDYEKNESKFVSQLEILKLELHKNEDLVRNYSSQVAFLKQEKLDMEEKYMTLEKANIFESSKKHLIKFIESLVMKKNDETESHLLILMSILEIKEPERSAYMEMLIPKDRRKSSYKK